MTLSLTPAAIGRGVHHGRIRIRARSARRQGRLLGRQVVEEPRGLSVRRLPGDRPATSAAVSASRLRPALAGGTDRDLRHALARGQGQDRGHGPLASRPVRWVALVRGVRGRALMKRRLGEGQLGRRPQQVIPIQLEAAGGAAIDNSTPWRSTALASMSMLLGAKPAAKGKQAHELRAGFTRRRTAGSMPWTLDHRRRPRFGHRRGLPEPGSTRPNARLRGRGGNRDRAGPAQCLTSSRDGPVGASSVTRIRA
jgi:hypothetical protein